MPVRRSRTKRYSSKTSTRWNRPTSKRTTSRYANGKPWTPTEVKTLRKIYKDTPNKEIARKFRRSISSIQAKAGFLGLHKNKQYMKKMRQGTWQ